MPFAAFQSSVTIQSCVLVSHKLEEKNSNITNVIIVIRGSRSQVNWQVTANFIIANKIVQFERLRTVPVAAPADFKQIDLLCALNDSSNAHITVDKLILKHGERKNGHKIRPSQTFQFPTRSSPGNFLVCISRIAQFTSLNYILFTSRDQRFNHIVINNFWPWGLFATNTMVSASAIVEKDFKN